MNGAALPLGRGQHPWCSCGEKGRETRTGPFLREAGARRPLRTARPEPGVPRSGKSGIACWSLPVSPTKWPSAAREGTRRRATGNAPRPFGRALSGTSCIFVLQGISSVNLRPKVLKYSRTEMTVHAFPDLLRIVATRWGVAPGCLGHDGLDALPTGLALCLIVHASGQIRANASRCSRPHARPAGTRTRMDLRSRSRVSTPARRGRMENRAPAGQGRWKSSETTAG